MSPEPEYVERAFLTESELEHFSALARGVPRERWEAGRQGTGYWKLALALGTDPVLDAVISRCRDRLGIVPGHDAWDRWLLFYPDGTAIPDHRDPAPPGKRHLRVNAVIDAPGSGGTFVVEGQAIPLERGAAVTFCPSERTHRVERCTGERLVLSVGALVDE